MVQVIISLQNWSIRNRHCVPSAFNWLIRWDLWFMFSYKSNQMYAILCYAMVVTCEWVNLRFNIIITKIMNSVQAYGVWVRSWLELQENDKGRTECEERYHGSIGNQRRVHRLTLRLPHSLSISSFLQPWLVCERWERVTATQRRLWYYREWVMEPPSARCNFHDPPSQIDTLFSPRACYCKRTLFCFCFFC